MDVNELMIDLVTPQVKVKRRSSFFNLKKETDEDNSATKAAYVEKLLQEKQDWIDVIQRTHGKVKE